MALPRRSAPPPPGPSAPSSSGYADVAELDKYRLIGNIGKGSFGVISKVQRIDDGKEFALKQLDYAKMTDKDRKQILAEVAILESLKHRNIVQLVQKIKDPKNERIYIVMEVSWVVIFGRSELTRSTAPLATSARSFGKRSAATRRSTRTRSGTSFSRSLRRCITVTGRASAARRRTGDWVRA
jgi:hypothetical protein